MADVINKAKKRQANKPRKWSKEVMAKQTARNKARRAAKHARIAEKKQRKIEERISKGKPVHHRHLANAVALHNKGEWGVIGRRSWERYHWHMEDVEKKGLPEKKEE